MAIKNSFVVAAVAISLPQFWSAAEQALPLSRVDEEFRRADDNNDGRITFREFAFYVAFYRPSILEDLKASSALHKASEEFKKANTSGTGYLSLKEFTSYFADASPAISNQNPAGYAAQHHVVQEEPKPEPKASPAISNQNPAGYAAQHHIVQEEPKPEEQPKDDAVTSTIAKYITIHKSFLSGIDKDASAPGTFNWTKPKDADATYSLDLAVSLQKDYTLYVWDWFNALGYRWTPFINGVFEAHVSTITSSTQDDLQYQGLLEWLGRAENPDNFVQAHHIYLRPMYETDRTKDVRDFRMNVDYTPDLDIFAWGETKSIATAQLGDFHPFRMLPKTWTFYWRPIIGLELNSIDSGLSVVSHDANLPNLANDYGFFRMQVQAQLNISNRLALTASWVSRMQLYGGCEDHNYVELSALCTLDPDEHYSVGVTYKRGEDSPKFEDLNVLSGFVGIQF